LNKLNTSTPDRWKSRSLPVAIVRPYRRFVAAPVAAKPTSFPGRNPLPSRLFEAQPDQKQRWNEKAGRLRDAISSPRSALEVQKETGHEEE
jgi:hypothetical protein